MKKLAALLFVLALLLGGVAWYHRRAAPLTGAPVLTAFCAASLRQPVEAAAAQYRQAYGVEVRLAFGGSGALLSSLRVAQKGDLYLPADEGAVADARKYGLVSEVRPVALQRPVIAVQKGNPKNIRAVADLLRDDVKIALANPDAASISRVSRTALGRTWEKLAARATVMKPTVAEVAADVSLGTVDASIIWDSMVSQYKIDAITAPELAGREEKASVCVLSFSTRPAAAARFARYLTAPEKGGTVLKAQGFTPAAGEPWRE